MALNKRSSPFSLGFSSSKRLETEKKEEVIYNFFFEYSVSLMLFFSIKFLKSRERLYFHLIDLKKEVRN